MSSECRVKDKSAFSVCVIGDAGGAHVSTRLSAISKQRAEVHLLSSRTSNLDIRTESVIAADGNSMMPPFLRWARAIKKSAGDVVSIQYANSWGAWVFALSRDRRTMILTVMGGDVLHEEQSKPHPLAIWLTHLVLKRADLITVKSSHLADVLSSQGIPEDRMTRLDWGIDGSIFKPGRCAQARQEMGLPNDSLIVFSPRILSSFYRIDVIVRAFAQVIAKEDDAVLVISEYEAEPGYRERLEDIAGSLGILDAIRFRERMTATEMATMYQSSDVVVGIPPSDGFPQTVLEAMACDIPNIVAPLVTYQEMLVADENVIFAKPNPDDLASAILRLKQNDQLRARLVQGGAKLLANFPSLDQSAFRLVTHLKRLSNKKTQNRLALSERCVGWFILLGFSLRVWIFHHCVKRLQSRPTASRGP